MRNFNTTAVNLRATLDDLDPLVDASKPVATRLGPFFAELRATAADAVPTIRDLDHIVRRPKPANDLVDLTKLQVPLANIAVGPVKANGATRQGAFPESVQSLEDSLPQLQFFRAYTAGARRLVRRLRVVRRRRRQRRHRALLGAAQRLQPSVIPANVPNVIPASPNFTLPLPPPLNITVPGFTPENSSAFFNAIDINNNERCPGANERDPGDNSTPFTDNGTLDCDPSQVPTGP